MAYLALLHKLFAYDSQSLIRAKTLVNEQANIIRNNLNLLSKNSKISDDNQNINLAHNVKHDNFNIEDTEILNSSLSNYLTTNTDLKKDMLGLFNNFNQKVSDLTNANYYYYKPTKFLSDNSIYELIDQYKQFLSTLSTYELCILMDILVSMFIFACLLTILSAFYGNYFIEKFSLETKFPKFSKIIKIKVKLQHFYIITNFIYIFLALFFLGYVNITTLFLN